MIDHDFWVFLLFDRIYREIVFSKYPSPKFGSDSLMVEYEVVGPWEELEVVKHEGQSEGESCTDWVIFDEVVESEVRS